MRRVDTMRLFFFEWLIQDAAHCFFNINIFRRKIENFEVHYFDPVRHLNNPRFQIRA